METTLRGTESGELTWRLRNTRVRQASTSVHSERSTQIMSSSYILGARHFRSVGKHQEASLRTKRSKVSGRSHELGTLILRILGLAVSLEGAWAPAFGGQRGTGPRGESQTHLADGGEGPLSARPWMGEARAREGARKASDLGRHGNPTAASDHRFPWCPHLC